MATSSEQTHIKAALEAAHAEIGKALKTVDTATPAQLQQLKIGARQLASFVDFHNGGCGAANGLTSSELLGNLKG